MKKLFLVTLLLSLFVSPSSSETLTIDDLIKREGIIYKKFSNAPYSGSLEQYYQTGQLKILGEFKNGIESGKWKFYTSTGELEYEENFGNAKKIGEVWNFFSDDGLLSHAGRYLNGIRDGKWRFYRVDHVKKDEKRLWQEKEWKDGKRVGIWKSYWRSGILHYSYQYSYGDQDEEYIKHKRLRRDGTIDFELKMKNGQYTMQKKYDHKGKTIYHRNWRDGEKHGLWVEYEEINYVDWNFKRESRQGQLLSKEYYIEGSLDGLKEEYYHNGQLKFRAKYKNGTQDSLIESYDIDGEKNNEYEVINNLYEHSKPRPRVQTACENAESLFIYDINKELAYVKFKELSKSGDSCGQKNLGNMYIHGRGVPRDFDKGIELLKKAAYQKDWKAMNDLGLIKSDSLKISAFALNYVEAYKWHKLSDLIGPQGTWERELGPTAKDIYKNSFAVPAMEWLSKRMTEIEINSATMEAFNCFDKNKVNHVLDDCWFN